MTNIVFDHCDARWVNEENKAPYLAYRYWNEDRTIPEALRDYGFHSDFREGVPYVEFDEGGVYPFPPVNEIIVLVREDNEKYGYNPDEV